ncbi:MAG: methylated-DNA--[protein]-cysteine S-methyltransferase [Lentisphaeria bacterium]
MYYRTSYNSPIGILTIVCEENRIIGVWIDGQKHFGGKLKEAIIFEKNCITLDKVKGWLDRYFSGEKPQISELALAPIGSEFRQKVWKILTEIPYGEVMTYGEIAQKIAKESGMKKMSSQAIGGAVGHNPISIIIPCHRVVGARGNLVGFSAGVKTKLKLLELEEVNKSKILFIKEGK